MRREIVLDTETTGLDTRRGDRIIEIACVELDDYTPTGRHFHCYIDPERDIDPDAERVHGISRAFLTGKPRFADPEVATAFLTFVADSPLVAHNAGFDRGFVNYELALAGLAILPEDRWVDTLALAQQRFPGMYNSLDALCKRFNVSRAERTKHGALIDAQLLAQVYLELRGGRERRLELEPSRQSPGVQTLAQARHGPRPRPLSARLSAAELAAHEAFVRDELKADSLWARLAAPGP
jgi:DNA polymerase-3 subunit epsilon